MFYFFRKKLVDRKLKSVLSISNSECFISTPVIKKQDNDVKFSSTHPNVVYAISYLLNINNRLNVESNLLPYNKISEYQKVMDEFCIGGNLANSRTASFLSEYCPTFVVVSKLNINEIHEDIENRLQLDELVENKDWFVYGYLINNFFC